MSKLDRVPVRVLAARIIADAHPALLAGLELKLTEQELKKSHRRGMSSLAIFTADCDDVGYIAIDEGTKHADAEVLYASSFYAGAANATMPHAGEFIGVFACRTPSDAGTALAAAIRCYEQEPAFQYADDAHATIFLAYTIAAAGSFLSMQAGVAQGQSLAYLIAPPLEAAWGMDAALKAATTKLVQYYAPPTPTNFSGGLLAGSLADCEAACAAFRTAVLEVAAAPLSAGSREVGKQGHIPGSASARGWYER